jgi:hypothetical protein
VLLPQYQDEQMKQIVNDIISQYSKVSYKYIDVDIEAHCEKLIYAPSASIGGDHANYVSSLDFIMPKRVANALYQYLYKPWMDRVGNLPVENTKLYLCRRGGRSLINYREVEQYFRAKGFLLVDQQLHLLPLDKKVALFSRASVIVCNFGAASMNTLFAQPGTKVMMLTPMSRVDDGIYFMFNDSGLDILQVIGNDCTSSPHTNYYISIDTIDAAYNELINSEGSARI